MDPTACLKSILEMLDKDDDRYDEEEARYRAEDLIKWMGNGGFPPDLSTLNAREAKLLSLLTCSALISGTGIGLSLSLAAN